MHVVCVGVPGDVGHRLPGDPERRDLDRRRERTEVTGLDGRGGPEPVGLLTQRPEQAEMVQGRRAELGVGQAADVADDVLDVPAGGP